MRTVFVSWTSDRCFDAAAARIVIANDEAEGALSDMEQSFSPDGGKTWEVNWICDLSR
jgi:hypothetical protein